MKSLTKLTIVIFLIVFCGVGVTLFLQKSSNNTGQYPEFPVGSENVPQEKGGVVPTTVGFDPKNVQPFDTLLNARPGYIFSSVLESTYTDVYGIFPCRIGEEETNVLMLTAKSTIDINGEVDTKTRETFKAWEPHSFADIGHFIFPKRTVPDSPRLVAFRDVGGDGYKSGQVTFSDGVGGYIYTGWRLNFCVFMQAHLSV